MPTTGLKLPGLGLDSSSPDASRTRAATSRHGVRPPVSVRKAAVRKFLRETIGVTEGDAHDDAEMPPGRDARSLATTLALHPSTQPPNESLIPYDISSIETDRSSYLELVAQLTPDAEGFRSAAVFCDALLRVARQNRPSPSSLAFDAVRAASACWALDRMSRHGFGHEIIAEIRDHLFPCLFIDFDKAPTAIRSIGTSEELVRRNPFIGYDFYFQHFTNIRNSLAQSRTRNAALAAKCGTTASVVGAVVNRLTLEAVRPLFKIWKKWVKGNRIDRFSKDLLRRHGNRDSRRVTLEAAMSRWRLSVAQSRIANLNQRVLAVEYQLENTKNQFQLQCFRSDKYLRLVEELREELAQVREQRDDLINESRTLRSELQDSKEKFRDELNRYVSVGIEELNRWRRFVRRRVDHDSARADALTMGTSGEGHADAEDAGEDAETGTDNTSAEIEAQLLHWCSSVMRQSVVSTVKEVTNWSSDWYSGEVLLLIMHHAFPGKVPLAALQEPAIPKRLEQIIEIGKKIGVAHLPKVSDIKEGAGDIMVLVAAELYNRYISMTRIRDTVVPFEAGKHNLDIPKNATERALLPPPTYDVDVLKDILADADFELRQFLDADRSFVAKDQHVWRTQEILNGYTSYITRERMEGRSVVVVDKKDVGRFCKFSKARYVDIAPRYRMPPLDFTGIWPTFDQQLDSLRAELQKSYQDLRRTFNFYCRAKPMMAESDFWRFIADIRILDKTVNRQLVDRIFKLSNGETPPAPASGPADDDDDEVAADTVGESEVEDDDNSETELIPAEFVECLVRIADRKFPGRPINERFDALMNVHVRPFACRSDADRFKKDIQAPQTQSTLQRYQKDLVKIFNFFSKGGAQGPSKAAGGRRTKTMTLQEFAYFVKETNIMSNALDEAAVSSVFDAVTSSVDETSKEIDQREFIEAIACLSVFKIPSPFVALDKKIEVLASSIINTLRSKLKSLLSLSDVALVTLRAT